MPKQRHWKNHGQGGETSFVTTTALDFVHVFRADKCREAMRNSLLDDCSHYKIVLHAFVIMPHHIHALMQPPEGMPISKAVQNIKRNAVRRVRDLVPPELLAELTPQIILNKHTFWKAGFRSVVVLSPTVFWQKVDYIHSNPVRAEYVSESSDYRWSSASAHRAGLWTEEDGLDIGKLLAGPQG